MWMNQNLLAIVHQAEDNGLNLFSRLLVPIKTWGANDDLLDDSAWTFDINKLKNLILLQYAEQNCYIGDPEQLQEAIGYWSESELPTWQALYESLFYKYNPIHNINYTESNSGSGSDTHSGGVQHTGSEMKTRTFNDTEQETLNLQDQKQTILNESHDTDTNTVTQKTETPATKKDITDNGTNTHSVAAFNNFGLTDNEKDTIAKTTSEELSGTISSQETVIGSVSLDDSGSNSETVNKTGTDTTAHTGTIGDNASDSWTDSDNRIINKSSTNTKTSKGTHYMGNLVTALIEYREYRSMNLYEYIARDFAKQFLIMIW